MNGFFNCRARADSRGDLITGDDALQKFSAAGAPFLGHRQRRGNHVDGGMSSPQPVALIHLQGHSGGCVGQGGEYRGG